MSSRSPVDVIRGSVDPEGAVTANLGTLYIRENTGTTATVYQKTAQAVAGVPDNTGWTLVSAGAAVDLWQSNGIFAPPDVADPDDDEFDSTVLNPAWGAGAGVWTAGSINPYQAYAAGDVRYMLHTDYRRSWLMMQPPADGVNKRLEKTFTTSANFFVWAACSFMVRRTGATTANDAGVGIFVSTDPWDTANTLALYLNEQDAGTTQAEFSKNEGGVNTSVNTTVSSPNLMPVIEAVGIQKIGTNYFGWICNRSGTWLYMGTTTFAPALGRVAVSTNNAATTAPGSAVLGIDFIRFIRSATRLP